MPETNDIHGITRQHMLDNRKADELGLRTEIEKALVPVTFAAENRRALEQWTHWLEQKHMYHGFGFKVVYDRPLNWLDNRTLIQLIRQTIEPATGYSTLHGTRITFRRRYWSWRKFRFVIGVKLQVDFDFERLNSTPR